MILLFKTSLYFDYWTIDWRYFNTGSSSD